MKSTAQGYAGRKMYCCIQPFLGPAQADISQRKHPTCQAFDMTSIVRAAAIGRQELGVQPPVGYWDPAGLARDGDAEAFKRRCSDGRWWQGLQTAVTYDVAVGESLHPSHGSQVKLHSSVCSCFSDQNQWFGVYPVIWRRCLSCVDSAST